jgi:outer membrane protein assembly factor BamB
MFSAPSALGWFVAISLVSGLASGEPRPAAPAHKAKPFIAWRFHVGGTLPGSAAVGADGTTYVGTSEGSLVAIGLDGVLLWSVTLDGSVAWPPVVGEGERVYVATAAQKIHAFFSSGARGWTLRSPVRIATDPVLAGWGILFGGGDGSVWAVSSRGAPLWHMEVGESLSATAGVQGNRIVVGTASGRAVFFDGASKRFVANLGARIRSAPVVFRDGSAAVLAGSSLFRLDQRAGVRWRRDGIEWFGTNGDAVYAVSDRRELMWLSTDGTPSRQARLGAKASGSPAAGDDAVFVPCDSGDVVLVSTDGAQRAINVGSSPLYAPVVDRKRHRVVLAAGDGTVAAISLPD